MKILGIIPSRYASTRFPGKPLVEIKGKSMIQRVYEQAKKATCLSDVIIATDDERIYNHAQALNFKVVYTDTVHQSGTDRCAEVLNKLDADYDVVINVQGDEPYINPEQIDEVGSCFEDLKTDIATLGKKITKQEELFNINKPKIAVLGLNPHSGDNGVIGQEENELIKPAIKSIHEKGIFVYGPYAADGFFGSEAYKQFDGVLAMYHDQGLAPFKALTFGNGVNFTAGLNLSLIHI